MEPTFGRTDGKAIADACWDSARDNRTAAEIHRDAQLAVERLRKPADDHFEFNSGGRCALRFAFRDVKSFKVDSVNSSVTLDLTGSSWATPSSAYLSPMTARRFLSAYDRWREANEPKPAPPNPAKDRFELGYVKIYFPEVTRVHRGHDFPVVEYLDGFTLRRWEPGYGDAWGIFFDAFRDWQKANARPVAPDPLAFGARRDGFDYRDSRIGHVCSIQFADVVDSPAVYEDGRYRILTTRAESPSLRVPHRLMPAQFAGFASAFLAWRSQEPEPKPADAPTANQPSADGWHWYRSRAEAPWRLAYVIGTDFRAAWIPGESAETRNHRGEWRAIYGVGGGNATFVQAATRSDGSTTCDDPK